MQPDQPTRGPHVQTHIVQAALPLSEAVFALRARPAADGWTRHVQRIEPVDLFAWLRAQDPAQRMYFAHRDGGLRVAGTGVAFERTGDTFDILEGLPTDEDNSADSNSEYRGPADGGLRALVSCRFDLSTPADAAWAPFGPVSARVPQVAIQEHNGTQWLAVVLAPNQDGAQIPLSVDSIAAPAHATPSHPATAEDERPAWRVGIARVLHEISERTLQKGVFTRREVHTADAPIDPLSVLERLDAQSAPAYRFLLQPTAECAFVGLTPERLYARRNQCIESEALAGTTPRGSTDEADSMLGEALLNSAKNRLEHDLVRRHIETQLAPLSSDLVCDSEPHLERLQHVQHLRTDVHGTLRDGVRDADVLAVLHPTPAVCGLPTERAMQVLRDAEGFDRGLYCGLVGLWRADEADFAVAIRSALICGNEVELYAGAGIVDGSDADAEWDETVDKLRTIGDVIGGDPCDD